MNTDVVNLLLLLLLVAVYFVPTIVAFKRQHHHRMAILALNVLLGTTGLGWIVALIWSLTAVRAPAST